MTLQEARAKRDDWRKDTSAGRPPRRNRGHEEEALYQLVFCMSASMARGVLEHAKILKASQPFVEPWRTLAADLAEEFMRAGYHQEAKLTMMAAGIQIPPDIIAIATKLEALGPADEHALARRDTAREASSKALRELKEQIGTPPTHEEGGW